jgi:predicted extracellular nuclease
MKALSSVTSKAPFAPIAAKNLSEEEFTTKKISRLMLELFEQIMPTLQNLNSSARQLATYSHEHFRKNSSREYFYQMAQGCFTAIGTGCAFTPFEGHRQGISSVSSALSSFAQSYQSDASTQKGTLQDLTSRSYQDQTTLQNALEKLLSLVQGVQQSERIPG